jgi:hypothetical protein
MVCRWEGWRQSQVDRETEKRKFVSSCFRQTECDEVFAAAMGIPDATRIPDAMHIPGCTATWRDDSNGAEGKLSGGRG